MGKEVARTELIYGDKRYTYFAFISYKREDGKWAEWLQRKLQSYRLPSKLCRQYQTLQQRCDPIFLDKTDLKPGYLEDGLQSEVREAKFLIIICSRACNANSKYIDLETQLFLDSGGDPSRIIPFIVDNEKEPEKTCFPKRLQELCAKRSIVGANVHEQGKRRAFLKVVAYMHGLKVQEVENNDDRRRRRNLLIGTAVSAAALTVAGIGGYAYWDFFVPKIAYYQDYVEVGGIPRGIGELDSAAARTMGGFFKITSSQHKVRSIQYESSFGVPLTPRNHELKETQDFQYLLDRIPYAEYTYTDEGELTAVSCFDEEGKSLVRMEYGKSLMYVDFVREDDKYGSAGYLAAHAAVEGETVEDEELSDAENTRTRIMRYILEYDANGYVSEVHYATDTNAAVADADGVGGLRFERDEAGRAVRVNYLSHIGTGTSAINADDYVVSGTRQGLFATEYVYDEQNDLREVRFLGKNDVLIPEYGGIASVRRTFRQHMLTEEAYFGSDGSPCLTDRFFASFKADYDAHGNRIKRAYYGTDGEPVLCDRGYASAVWTYDDYGRTHTVHFFDTDGAAVLSQEGYAGAIFTCDDKGRDIGISYIGTDDKPVKSADGTAGFLLEYDEADRLIRKTYKGTDEKPAVCSDGYAIVTCEYDEKGQLVKESFFDPDDHPVGISKGYAVIMRAYNENGEETNTSFFGADGAPASSVYGYASCVFRYDERGNHIGTSYYGTDGAPVNVPDEVNGLSGNTYEYDDRGRLVRVATYTADGRLETGTYGYAVGVLEYDDMGNNISESYFGTDEKPVRSIEKFSRCTREYDPRGNLLRESFFDTDGSPILCDDGYAIVEMLYDAYGNEVRIDFLDTDRKPVMMACGYAGCEIKYNDYGWPVRYSYYDGRGQLTDNEDGFAVQEIRYDAGGQPIEEVYYDAEGHIV